MTYKTNKVVEMLKAYQEIGFLYLDVKPKVSILKRELKKPEEERDTSIIEESKESLQGFIEIYRDTYAKKIPKQILNQVFDLSGLEVLCET